jgi:hypothetical protein
MTEPFYLGFVNTNGYLPWMQWDGSNEDEIADWLGTLHVGQYEDTWSADVIDEQLVLTGTPHSGVQPSIPVNSYVTIQPASGRNITISVPPETQDQYWKTSNPYGRPEDVNDIAGGSPDADVE